MRFLIALLALSPVCAEQNADVMLAGIREKMRDNLARLPNYTCRLTIDRSFGRENAKRLRPIDTVHIEVGYVDGKELYAWPGQRFANKPLEEMMPSGGAVGTGDFALHVKSIFLTNAPTFTFAGRTEQEGHDAIRFDFKVPQKKSRYLVRSGPERQQVVGYHGSFWADAQTLLLRRLEITLDDIPAALGIRRAGSLLNYAVTRIGGADFLLPHSSELFIVDAGGRESRNRTRFEQCHQYMGESIVSFADPSSLPETPKPVTIIQLPAGLLLDLTLQGTIDGTRAVIGDPIHAVVSKDVAKSGAIVVPKGAKVTGRITRLGQRTAGRLTYQVLGLRFSTIEFDDHKAEFLGHMESVAVAALQVTIGEGNRSNSHRRPPPGAGDTMLYIKGNSLRLPAGAHMYWRTHTEATE